MDTKGFWFSRVCQDVPYVVLFVFIGLGLHRAVWMEKLILFNNFWKILNLSLFSSLITCVILFHHVPQNSYLFSALSFEFFSLHALVCVFCAKTNNFHFANSLYYCVLSFSVTYNSIYIIIYFSKFWFLLLDFFIAVYVIFDQVLVTGD
jgi:hypothetical protein